MTKKKTRGVARKQRRKEGRLQKKAKCLCRLSTWETFAAGYGFVKVDVRDCCHTSTDVADASLFCIKEPT